MNTENKMSRRRFGKLAAGAGLIAIAGGVLPNMAVAQEKPAFRDIRRKERALTEDDAWAILDKGIYGVLATVDQNAQPHGTPISYASGDGYIYFHGAKRGQKIDNMKANPRVCFTVVGEAEPIFINEPFDYSVYFASTMAYGNVQVLEGDEKKRALMTLVKKYFPQNLEGSDAYYEKYGKLIDVWGIKVDRITAKAHKRNTAIVVPQ